MDVQMELWAWQQRQSDCRRYLVFSGDKREHLCVAMARSESHALKVARQLFRLPREAYATLERPR